MKNRSKKPAVQATAGTQQDSYVYIFSLANLIAATGDPLIVEALDRPVVENILCHLIGEAVDEDNSNKEKQEAALAVCAILNQHRLYELPPVAQVRR